MAKKVNAKEQASVREQRVLEFWHEQSVFQRTEKERRGGPEFVFYEGPPTANGKPHPGHVLTRVIKDVYPRYRTMKGYHVMRKAGWDTHGLPVEIEIEKKFGISGKKQIESFGVEKFIQACRESVFQYEATWREMTERLGYWVDLDNPYMTLKDEYIESVWHLLKTIYERGYLYQGHRVSPYCPHCETTLSSHEVAQGYENVKDLSVTVKFRLPDDHPLSEPGIVTSFLAWTTTPWTLPSHVALAVHPDIEYVRILSPSQKEAYWVASALQENFLGDDGRVTAQALGRELAGTPYSPVFPYVNRIPGKKFEVIQAMHVTDESGTGIVHQAPAFGEDDYKACREHGMAFCNFVDETGCFTDDVTDFAGRFVKDEEVNVDIVRKLSQAGLLYSKEKFEHSYPHCWRCGTPLLYYAIDSWFIRMTDVREKLLENSNRVNWIPEHVKTGRMGNFLQNVVDWNLSRNRYWGTPLPIWRCNHCHQEICIGSRKELLEKTGQLPKELHKPYIDELTFACTCGGTFERVPEVIDVWFDSGSMPFAQHHYPFENEEQFARQYPADFISEAIDQTRGWFYSLLAISTLITGEAPYKNVLVMGHVLDEQGKKMSKSKGNVIDPFEALDQHGADALRFYFLSNTQPWNSQLFYHRAVAESKAKFLDILQNVHAFYALYAAIDQFSPTDYDIPVVERPLFDRWLMARLHETIRTVDASLDSYDATAGARALQNFVDDVSTWYVRRNRERFWASGMESDKIAAFLTLAETLTTLSKLIAPYTPFIAEEIYQNVTRDGGTRVDIPVSVHLCAFPAVDEALIDEQLIQEMSLVLRVVEAGRLLRNESKCKTRQPLETLYVTLDWKDTLQAYEEILKDELNVKQLVYTTLNEVAEAEIYLDLKALGKSFGSKVPLINAAAKTASIDQIHEFVQRGVVDLAGETITREHGDIRYKPCFTGVMTHVGQGFVGLNTELTPALIEEGYVRELISKMQMMRKEVNYEVTEWVKFFAEGDSEIMSILRKHLPHIQSTVLMKELVTEPIAGDLQKEWDINGKSLTLTVARIS
ncbi:isoleucine--tRNA ligase [Alicyclobacillus sp. TC]|uniref:isoleucine--tRNA ligase n=1 Tax=Alicyclobacillus sp. TC TaxID=2606450 RepID=UPI001932138E|nr:isoleucine--tRNA ligase [Alicyclobacillus sp. TC]QRF24266.1 isoleucine--tRNA ligase [Alicyclobacillus sp. TC]